MIIRTRAVVAVAAAATLTLAAATTASADPVDIGDASAEIILDNTIWETDAWSDWGFTIGEASVFPDPVDPADPWAGPDYNGDAFDGALELLVDDVSYGEPDCTGTCTYTVDITDSGSDVVVTAPAESLSGLDVAVQQRYYAGGDLARVIAGFGNPTGAPITVEAAFFSDYGSDSDTVLEADSSGDAAVTVADNWFVTGDDGSYDPVVGTAFWGPAATLAPSTELIGDDGEFYTDESLIVYDLTVPAGETVYLGAFVTIAGYEGALDDDVAADGLAAAVVAGDYDAAVASSILAADEFDSFSGRLTAGIPVGTAVLNWGVAAAAPAATPVVVAPAFTG